MSKEDLVSMFEDIVAGMDSLIFQLARKEHQLRNSNVGKVLSVYLPRSFAPNIPHIEDFFV